MKPKAPSKINKSLNRTDLDNELSADIDDFEAGFLNTPKNQDANSKETSPKSATPFDLGTKDAMLKGLASESTPKEINFLNHPYKDEIEI